MASRKWTEEEVEYLKENCDKLPRDIIAKNINRTIQAVEDKSKKININLLPQTKQKQKNWTEEDIKFLTDNYQKLDTYEICDILGRSHSSVVGKAGKLGIIKYRESGKEGYCFCKNCGRELPRTYNYFPPDKSCVDGLRSVCRECSSANEGFLPEDFKQPYHQLSEDEEKLFIERYPDYLTKELLEIFYPDWSIKGIQDKANSLRKKYGIDLYKSDICIEKQTEIKRETAIKNFTTIDRNGNRTVIISEEARKKHSKAMKEYYKTHDSHWLGRTVSEEERKMSSERARGKWAGGNNPRAKNPLNGSANGMWNGGATPLYSELRTQINEWKNNSIKNCNYKCVITGKSFNHIHHLVPFKQIVDEVFDNLKLDIRKNVGDYSDEEFSSIVLELNRLHDGYPLGACLCEKKHKEFHMEYGYTNNTPEQFYEFINKHKKRNIIERVVEWLLKRLLKKKRIRA